MQQLNGSVRITSRPDGSHTLTWLPTGWAGGAARPPRLFPTERELTAFLVNDLRIEEQVFTEELHHLRADAHRPVIIPNVWVSDEELERYGLGP